MRGVNILPPTFLFLFLALAFILYLLFPIANILGSYRLFGIIFVAIGIAINIWADSIFKKEKTTIKPNEIPSSLVIKGPFCFSRHPMYLGSVLILLGVAIALGALSSFLSPILMFIILDKKFIPFEEKQMEKIFGKKYLKYKKQVRRWI